MKGGQEQAVALAGDSVALESVALEPTEPTKPGTSSPAQEAQPDAQIPQTGGQTAAWFPLLAAAGVFAAGACVGRRKRGR